MLLAVFSLRHRPPRHDANRREKLHSGSARHRVTYRPLLPAVSMISHPGSALDQERLSGWQEIGSGTGCLTTLDGQFGRSLVLDSGPDRCGTQALRQIL